ncbi:MAG: hypothetical protein IPH45_00345 [Bacteroidales bacterium]|nr:hypothetical protein [Bacteroidales bacterium]
MAWQAVGWHSGSAVSTHWFNESVCAGTIAGARRVIRTSKYLVPLDKRK